MEEVKKTVEIRSMDEQIRLFGVFDENLKVIEAETGTSIRSDAENILISGEEENTAIAQNVIEKLLMLIRKDEDRPRKDSLCYRPRARGQLRAYFGACGRCYRIYQPRQTDQMQDGRSEALYQCAEA